MRVYMHACVHLYLCVRWYVYMCCHVHVLACACLCVVFFHTHTSNLALFLKLIIDITLRCCLIRTGQDHVYTHIHTLSLKPPCLKSCYTHQSSKPSCLTSCYTHHPGMAAAVIATVTHKIEGGVGSAQGSESVKRCAQRGPTLWRFGR